jgi:FlaA1/EpsC-like NDP-sugar epimerase
LTARQIPGVNITEGDAIYLFNTMLSHRIQVLWVIYHGILVIILTILFWSYLTVVESVLKDFAPQNFQTFIWYNLAGVLGLLIAAFRGRSAATSLARAFPVECHTLASKQIVYVGVTMLVALFAVTDPMASRLLKLCLLSGFLLVLYLVFVICHLFLPKMLADELLSTEKHEQRTLLIGPVEKARKIAKWVEETPPFGFGIRDSVTDDESRESRILHVKRASDVAMLERIIKNEGIEQIILLEIPIDREGLSLILEVEKKAGIRLLFVNNLTEISNDDIALFNLRNHRMIILAV